MARNLIQLKYKVGTRLVTIQATDQIGPEDCYDNHVRAVLHRYATNGKEDLLMPIPRDVKDFMIRTNLFI
jgi:hypothetical protein